MALAARRWAPVPQTAQAQLKRVIVGFEPAKASGRPQRMIGKKLTPEDEAALQAGFVRRLDALLLSTDHWRFWDSATGQLTTGP